MTFALHRGPACRAGFGAARRLVDKILNPRAVPLRGGGSLARHLPARNSTAWARPARAKSPEPWTLSTLSPQMKILPLQNPQPKCALTLGIGQGMPTSRAPLPLKSRSTPTLHLQSLPLQNLRHACASTPGMPRGAGGIRGMATLGTPLDFTPFSCARPPCLQRLNVRQHKIPGKILPGLLRGARGIHGLQAPTPFSPRLESRRWLPFALGLGLVGWILTHEGPVHADAVPEDALLVHADPPPVKALDLAPVPPPSTRVILQYLAAVLYDSWVLLLAVVAVTLATAGVNILTPVVLGQLTTAITQILKTKQATGITDLGILKVPGALLMALFAGNGALTALDISLVTRLGEDIAGRMRLDLFGAILKQDMSFFDSRAQGEIMSRVMDDVQDIKHTLKQTVNQGLRSVAQLLGSFYSLIALSPTLTLSMLSCVPFLYVTLSMYGTHLRALSVQAREADTELQSTFAETLSNIKAVRSFVAEPREAQKFERALARVAETSQGLGLHIGIFQGLNHAIIGGVVGGIMYYGGGMVAQGHISSGGLMTFLVTTQNAQRALTVVGNVFGQVNRSLGSAGRVWTYLNWAPTIPLVTDVNPPSFKGSVEFDRVSFAYPARPDHLVLDNFSLRIPHGKMVALCGASGGGKSTVGALIERFYDPTAGEIRVDSLPLTGVSPAHVRSNTAYITQEPFLFSTTIRDNIAYGCQTSPGPTDAALRSAAARAHCLDFIEGPQGIGWDTPIKAATLSGGQKQRICLARAFLQDPAFLILDEATSALDAHSEALVQAGLAALMKGRTGLVIAHRLGTVRHADEIVVLGPGGVILENGTHDELVGRRNGVYRELWRVSNGGAADSQSWFSDFWKKLTS